MAPLGSKEFFQVLLEFLQLQYLSPSLLGQVAEQFRIGSHGSGASSGFMLAFLLFSSTGSSHCFHIPASPVDHAPSWP